MIVIPSSLSMMFSALLIAVALLNLVVVPTAVWLLRRRTDRLGRAGALAGASERRWNPLAVTALLLAFAAPGPAPLIAGYAALREIRWSRERGRGLALTAVILGYMFVAFVPLLLAYHWIVAPWLQPDTAAQIDSLTDQIQLLQDQLKNGTQLDDLTGKVLPSSE